MRGSLEQPARSGCGAPRTPRTPRITSPPSSRRRSKRWSRRASPPTFTRMPSIPAGCSISASRHVGSCCISRRSGQRDAARIGWGDAECQANVKAHRQRDYVTEIIAASVSTTPTGSCARQRRTWVASAFRPSSGWGGRISDPDHRRHHAFHALNVPKRLYVLPGGHGVALGQKLLQQDESAGSINGSRGLRTASSASSLSPSSGRCRARAGTLSAAACPRPIG